VYKPEHAVLGAFAAFVAKHRDRSRGPKEPDTVLVVPTGDCSRRATMRRSRRGAPCAHSPRAVGAGRRDPEHVSRGPAAVVRAIHLPACRAVSDAAWGAIVAAVRRAPRDLLGLVRGDDAGNAAVRLGVGRQRARAGRAARGIALRYPLAVYESTFAATGSPSAPGLPGERTATRGAARVGRRREG
jgi:hypothetical protein